MKEYTKVFTKRVLHQLETPSFYVLMQVFIACIVVLSIFAIDWFQRRGIDRYYQRSIKIDNLITVSFLHNLMHGKRA